MRKAGNKVFETDEEAIDYLEKTADELFDLANSFGGDETGDVACTLHGAPNKIRQAIKILKGELDVLDAYKESTDSGLRAIGQIKIVRALRE